MNACMHLALWLSILAALSFVGLLSETAEAKPNKSMSVLVTSFGAKGDGRTDDTAAFQKALNAVGKAEGGVGGVVSVPAGNYLVKGHLAFPPRVAMVGVTQAVNNGRPPSGSILLSVEGAGKADGTPFLSLATDCVLKGLTIRYPNQGHKNLKPYPWTVRGAGDNISIIDVQMTNPWQAVDFGTNPCGRHLIRNLYAWPMYRGLLIDKCYDCGRVENVHFWPFGGQEGEVKDFVNKNAEAFIIGRTDWEFMSNCFCIGYKVGYHFLNLGAGPGNVLLTQCGSDIGPCAALIEDCQPHSGISFENGQMMAGVVIKDTNSGPVKFSNCGFFSYGLTPSHVTLAGDGQLTLNACHFIGWDGVPGKEWKAEMGTGAPAVRADRGNLIVSACNFIDDQHNHIYLGPNVNSAVITGNRFHGGAKIKNESKGDVQIGLNATR